AAAERPGGWLRPSGGCTRRPERRHHGVLCRAYPPGSSPATVPSARRGQSSQDHQGANDILLTLMLFDCASQIQSETILFHDAFTTRLAAGGGTFRRATEDDQGRIFPHMVEPVGEWVIEVDREVAATGGILFHYNIPYGDIYMEVAEPFRQRGFGGYLV